MAIDFKVKVESVMVEDEETQQKQLSIFRTQLNDKNEEIMRLKIQVENLTQYEEAQIREKEQIIKEARDLNTRVQVTI